MTRPRASEAELIARYFAPLAGPGARGLQDDAASLTPNPGHDLVVTTDAIVAGVHYFPDDPPASVARKALGVNLSDLAAKGATPRGFVLTIGLPDDWSEDWLAAFAAGLGATARTHGCPLLGGDTVRLPGPTTLSITAFGEVPHGAMVPRHGAQAGDRLFVSGTIGDATLGLTLRSAPDGGLARSLGESERAHLLDRYLHPRPRTGLAPVLLRHARAAMDVSDGLAGDLAKLVGPKASARVDIASIPLSPAVQRAVLAEPRWLDTALTGGDDYEILCAIEFGRAAAFAEEAREVGIGVTAIGTIEAGSASPTFIQADGQARSYARGSFSHF